MRTVPGSHRPEQPRWLAPLIDIVAAAAMTVLTLEILRMALER